MKLKTLAIIFFSIFSLLSIGIIILNDDSTWQTIALMWMVVGAVVAFYFVVSYIRKKLGSE